MPRAFWQLAARRPVTGASLAVVGIIVSAHIHSIVAAEFATHVFLTVCRMLVEAFFRTRPARYDFARFYRIAAAMYSAIFLNIFFERCIFFSFLPLFTQFTSIRTIELIVFGIWRNSDLAENCRVLVKVPRCQIDARF